MTTSQSIPHTKTASTLNPDGNEQADHLYAEGMAYYQRRQWRQALAAFSRLQEMDPQRQGIGALIDESNWFIQLEEMAPEQREQEPEGGITANKLRWLPWLLSFLILVVATAIILFVAGDRIFNLPGRGPDPGLVELYNEGQSQLAVGNYDGAVNAFEQILAIDSDDIGARAGLTQAKLLRDMAKEYSAAQTAIVAEDWGAAKKHLDTIISVYPTYEDVNELQDFVGHQQDLSDLYTAASDAYNASAWGETIHLFEGIRERDETYRTETIQEFLFVSYLEEGERLIEEQSDDLNAVRQALRFFNAALTIHPENQRASENRQLAALFESGVLASEREDWNAVIEKLEIIYEQQPIYGGGLVACLLYKAYVALAVEESEQGNYHAALDYAQQALALELPPRCEDKGEAHNIEQAILLALATPTPTSTATATHTPTPLPTATPTLTPRPTNTSTITPIPPTPTQTFTPAPPTDTPHPTDTPRPTKPPKPTNTPTPDR